MHNVEGQGSWWSDDRDEGYNHGDLTTGMKGTIIIRTKNEFGIFLTCSIVWYFSKLNQTRPSDWDGVLFMTFGSIMVKFARIWSYWIKSFVEHVKLEQTYWVGLAHELIWGFLRIEIFSKLNQRRPFIEMKYCV